MAAAYSRHFFPTRTSAPVGFQSIFHTSCNDFRPVLGLRFSGTLSMVRLPILSFFLALSAGALCAQVPIPRANVEIDAAGVFPVDGFKAEEYSTGPGLRVGGEFRLHRNLVAEGGWTGVWMATYYDCSHLGCSYSRLENKFLDYGLRGVL